MKLGLGTVQFGTDYGVSNSAGKTSPEEVERILALADQAGVQVLDTAAMYGDSESVLGSILGERHHFRIVTKTPSFKERKSITSKDAEHLEKTFHRSLERLQQPSVYSLLVHHSEDLLKPGGELLIEVMLKAVAQGLVEKIGVSVYSSQDIDQVLKLITPDIMQLPISIFDQRLLVSGHLRKLKNIGVELHARSVFLQGLLLMNVDCVAPYFDPIRQHLKAYEDFLLKHDMNRLQGALCFLMKQKELDTILVGVCSAQQLREVLNVLGSLPNLKTDMSGWAVFEERFVNPYMWQLSNERSS